jgi:hypothetical protein
MKESNIASVAALLLSGADVLKNPQVVPVDRVVLLEKLATEWLWWCRCSAGMFLRSVRRHCSGNSFGCRLKFSSGG